MRVAVLIAGVLLLADGAGDKGVRPACDATRRSWRWQVEGGAGVADTIDVCQKKADDTYAWVSLDAQPGQGGGSQCDAYPVGAIHISTVSTNPGTSLGCGSWSAFGAGRVLVGVDAGQTEFDTGGETGGAKTHTLTAAEMPSHTHVQDAHTHTLPVGATDDTAAPFDRADAGTNASGANATTASGSTTATNQSTGGGGAHNNLQPYVVVYMWRRDS